MPASTKLNSSAPRSRTGCLVCRSRRVKCDEVKPTCGRCEKFNAECRYPDKKNYSDLAIAIALADRHEYRRRARRDAPAVCKAGSTDAESGALGLLLQGEATSCGQALGQGSNSRLVEMSACRSTNEGWFKFDKFEAETALFRLTRMGDYYHHPSDPPPLLQVVFPDDIDRRCFHHCITYSLSIMTVEMEKRNPWVQHVAPLCFSPQSPVASTEALRSAFLAFGATHLYSLQLRHSDTSDAADYQAVSRRHSALSASRLRQIVQRGGAEIESETFMAATLALLLNEVFAAGTRWRELWRYVLMAIRARNGPNHILFGNGHAPTPLQRCLMGHAAFWDFVVSINTMSSPVLLCGDLTWWQQLSDIAPNPVPRGRNQPGPAPPDLECDWLEKFTAMHPRLLAITATIVGCAADKAELERLVGPVDVDTQPAWLGYKAAGGEAHRQLTERAGTAAAELERWRYELPTSLSSARVQIGSLALWHAARILLLTQVYSRPRLDPDVQGSARAVMELCFEAGDKPEFLQVPVMVACSVLEDEEQRESARAIIRTMEYVAVFEVQSLCSVVEEGWRRMAEGVDDIGCRWPDVHAELGRTGLIC